MELWLEVLGVLEILIRKIFELDFFVCIFVLLKVICDLLECINLLNRLYLGDKLLWKLIEFLGELRYRVRVIEVLLGLVDIKFLLFCNKLNKK